MPVIKSFLVSSMQGLVDKKLKIYKDTFRTFSTIETWKVLYLKKRDKKRGKNLTATGNVLLYTEHTETFDFLIHIFFKV